MAARWHFNPETGRTGRCDAKKQCRFAKDGVEPEHYETAELAQQAYAAKMQDSLVPTATKDPNAEVYDKYDSPSAFTVPFDKVDEALALVDRANRKLERAGIKERFEPQVEVVNEERKNMFGFTTFHKYAVIRLNKPTISYGGHKFLAVVDKVEKGVVVRAADGVDLSRDGLRPESLRCDHCGHNRHRTKTYVIQAPDGRRLQVGSTCVKPYLGVKPEGLFAVGVNPLSKMSRSGWSGPPPAFASEDVLALSLVFADRSGGFVTTGHKIMYGGKCTADEVKEFLDFAPRTRDERLWAEGVRGDAERAVASGRVAEALEVGRTLEGDGDYAQNVRVLASGESCEMKHVAILSSVLATVERQNRRKAAQKRREGLLSSLKPGFLGKAGDKVNGRQAVVISNRVVWGHDYKGWPVERSMLVMMDKETGKRLFWPASREVRVPNGATVTFKSGRIKNHETYKGQDSTVLRNIRVDEVGQADWHGPGYSYES